MLPFLIRPGSDRGWIWLILSLVTFWVLSNIWYTQTYVQMMPFRSFLLFNNLSPLLFDSVVAAFRWTDLIVVVPFLLLLAYYFIFRKNMKAIKYSGKKKILYSVIAICRYLCLLVATTISVYVNEKDLYPELTKKEMFFNKFTNYSSQLHDFRLNGFIINGTYAFIQNLASSNFDI